MLETKLAEAEEARTRLEAEIREAKYDEQIREKAAAIRHPTTGNHGEFDVQYR